MSRVVTFGELMLRLSPPGRERLFQSPALQTWFGGSEANVAAGLARFGVRSDYVTRLPHGPVGDAALAALRAEGIGTAEVLRGGDRLGIYFVEPGADLRAMRVVYDRAGSAFARLDAGELDWTRILAGAGWFHVSGITPALGDGPACAAAAAVRAAHAAGIPVSVDLNYRAALWEGRDPASLVAPLVQGCALLVANPAAVAAMLGIGSGDGGDDDALRALAGEVAGGIGCGAVALTRRAVVSASEHAWDAVLHDPGGGETHRSRPYRVRVVDRVGGGDAFAAGLIYATLAGRAPAAALDFAAAAGALKLTVPGDFPRASADEVDALLQDS